MALFCVGVTYCLSAAAFYAVARYEGRDAEALKSVTRVKSLKDLDTDSKLSSSIVTISGRVGSKYSISCRSSDLGGVIVDETAEVSFITQDDAGRWKKDSEIFPKCKEVPWYLDDGTGRAFVVGARGAPGFVLSIGSQVFEEAAEKSSQQGLQILGVKRVERVLPIGTQLTVVGEVVKDRIGKICVQQPQNGPFYVSHKSIDQLIKDLGDQAMRFKICANGFAFVGVFLLVNHALPYITERVRLWQLRKRIAAKKSTQKCEDLCIICMEQEYNSVFVKCGHMCCCMKCSLYLTNCPICRRRIEKVVQTFHH